MAVNGDTSNLPDEIITEILIRLSVKSLKRFQIVCKHWKNLINSPSFTAEHLHHSTRQNPCLLLQHRCSYGHLHLWLLDSEMQVRQVHSTHSTHLIDSLLFIRIVGSINGLLCLKIKDMFLPFLSLWNPAIREIRQVPRIRNINQIGWNCIVGFGYSPIANDYKIVRIYYESYVISGAEVYSLSTDSWKEIELKDLKGVHLRLLPLAVSANGSIFWQGEKEGKGDIDVIALNDIAMEVFTLIPLRTSSFKLSVYDDKLALISYHNEDKVIALWVLEKGMGSFVDKWSWTKKYTNSLYICASMLHGNIWSNQIACYPLSIYSNDDELEVDDLYLFNITTNKFKMFVIPIVDDVNFIFNYVESLVPIDNIHIEQP